MTRRDLDWKQLDSQESFAPVLFFDIILASFFFSYPYPPLSLSLSLSSLASYGAAYQFGGKKLFCRKKAPRETRRVNILGSKGRKRA